MSEKTPADSNLSPVFARAEAARPRVQAPDSPFTLWAGVIGSGLLGLLVFNGLSSSSHTAHAQTQPSGMSASAPPPPPAAASTPAPPPPVATPQPPVMQAPIASPPDPAEAHWRAPAMVVDFSGAPDTAPVQMAQATAGAPGVPVNDGQRSADERFAARVVGSTADTARATQMHDLGRTVPQGAVIAATLETAINSDLPGSVRAVVSRDVRSFDGSRVLIPRGSKLIGQYKSAVAIGQTRAFVVWSRIISPAGVSIDVGSPGTDRLGRGGLDGEVDTHFIRRFGGAILLSVVSAGTQALANSTTHGDNTTLVIGSATQANQVASVALEKQIEMPDTIKVPQGVPVQVFVARDLDFSGVVR